MINKNCDSALFGRPFWEREKYGPLRENQIDTFLWVNSNLKSLASVKSIWLFRKMQKSGTIDEWYGTSSIISYSFLFGSGFAYLMFKQIDNNLTYYSIMHHHIRVFIYLHPTFEIRNTLVDFSHFLANLKVQDVSFYIFLSYVASNQPP